MTDVMTPVAATLRKVFGSAESYVTYMASFFDLYAFTICRNDASRALIGAVEPQAVDDRTAQTLPACSLLVVQYVR